MEACYSGLRMTLEESMARLWEGKHCLLDGQCIFGRQSLGLTVDARQRGVLYISEFFGDTLEENFKVRWLARLKRCGLILRFLILRPFCDSQVLGEVSATTN